MRSPPPGFLQPRLVLEITESLMLVDTDFGIQQLHELKSLGIRLAMDDFGTGYSSLSYLSRFPVDILKMDRSFVGSGDNEALTSAIIALGDSLSLDVVAEGIELQEQASSLQARGCKIGQGYLFARPMTSAALNDFLTLAAATRRRRGVFGVVQCSIVTTGSIVRHRRSVRRPCRRPVPHRSAFRRRPRVVARRTSRLRGRWLACRLAPVAAVGFANSSGALGASAR